MFATKEPVFIEYNSLIYTKGLQLDGVAEKLTSS